MGAAQATPVIIRLKYCPTAKKTAVFQLTGASPNPAAAGDLAVNAGEIRTELPAQSVSTLVVQAP
jgi:O-glycosyl hydrolase